MGADKVSYGFDRGLTPERIIGATDSSGKTKTNKQHGGDLFIYLFVCFHFHRSVDVPYEMGWYR